MSSTCVVVVNPGQVHMECAESITAVVTTKAAAWAFYHKSGPYMDMARNEVVRRFYQSQFDDCNYLLMVDSDIEFTPSDVQQLETDDLPIVSGVYHNIFNDAMLPIAYMWSEERDGMRPITQWPDGGDLETHDDPIVAVDGVGAGFLMLRRDMLDAMREHYGEPCPWFAEDVVDGVHFGEDLYFSIRAANMGFSIHVDRRVRVAHHKQVRLGGQPITCVPVTS